MSTARLAGGLHLSMVPLGVFSFVYVPSALIVRGNAAATWHNIAASEWLFRAGIASHILSQIVAVFLVLAFYRLFKPVSADGARLMVVLAAVSIQLACLNEVNNLAALRLFASSDAYGMQFLDMARDGVLIAQIFWGLWMLPLAALIYRSGFLPRLLAAPVLIAAAGYLIDSTTQLLFPGLSTISQFTFAAELLLPLWLITKGVNARASTD